MVIKNKIVIYAFLAVLIVGLAVAGIALVVHNNNKTQGYVKTKAVVIDYRERFDYDDYEMMYCEVVEYIVDGVAYKASNDVWTNVPKAIGKEIEIAYNPYNPSQCVFVKSQNVFPIICFVISGLCLVALILQAVKDISEKRKRNDDYYEHNLIA